MTLSAKTITNPKALVQWVRSRVRQDVDAEMLKARGAKIGDKVRFASGVMIDPEFCWLIEIGDGTGFGPRVIVLAHDAAPRHRVGYTRIARVKIGPGVFIGAGSIILPGVTIGADSIVGAGTVVNRDVPEGAIVAGNPMRVVGNNDEFQKRHFEFLEDSPKYPLEGWTVTGGITPENAQKMYEALDGRHGYVK